MEDEIKEKELANAPKPIRVEVLENLISKLKTYICKIKCSDGGYGTGFFCNISYNWQLTIKVLITSYHVLKKDDLLENKIIKFSINNERQQYKILIDDSRKIYANDEFDITIVELKEKDKIDENYFFDLDNEIFNENSQRKFINKDIYLLHYIQGEMGYSNGIIKNICENNYIIQHLCSSYYGSSGGPLINSINFKVIGIHRGAAKLEKYNYNYGTFLKEPIMQFKEQIKKSPNKMHIIIVKKESVKENKNIKPKMIVNKSVDEITIQYKVNNFKNLKIRIFGDEFVKNNKDKCKIIIHGKEIELCTHININIKQLISNKIYEIKLKGIRNITNMSCIFKGDIFNNTPLYSLPDLSKWNTNNILNMSGIFYYCSSIKSLPDISKWNTQNVTNMSDMFYECSSLLSLPDISEWNTQNVTDMSNMFFGCSSIKSLPDISKWNTQNVINMSYLFYGCSSLLSLPDISKWKTKNVINMKKRFTGCSSLLSFPNCSQRNSFYSNNIKSDSIKEMIKSKKILNKSKNNKKDDKIILNMNINQITMQKNDDKELIKTKTNINQIANHRKDDKKIIKAKTNINQITIQYNIKNIKDNKSIRIFGDEFVKNNKDKCKIIINGKEKELCSHININLKQINDNEIYVIKLKEFNNITNMSGMFKSELEDEIPLLSITNISKWNTKNVIDMSDMFYGCSSLLSLPDISKLNTQNVINMNNLLYGCSSIKSLPDISKWNTQKVTNMAGMFSDCSSLSSLPDISKWDTKNVTNMKSMFSGCLSLPSLPDISKWNTQNIIDMSYMFYECSSISSLPDISNWNTQNVNNMSYMFYECSSLLSLPDISKWNTQNVNDISGMFEGIKKLNIPKKFQEEINRGCFLF